MQRKLCSDDKVGTAGDLEVTRAALQVECKRQRLLKQQILQQMHTLAHEYALHDVSALPQSDSQAAPKAVPGLGL